MALAENCFTECIAIEFYIQHKKNLPSMFLESVIIKRAFPGYCRA